MLSSRFDRWWRLFCIGPQGAIKNVWISGVACIKAPLIRLLPEGLDGKPTVFPNVPLSSSARFGKQSFFVSSSSAKTNWAVLTRSAHSLTGIRFLRWILWLPLSWSGATRWATNNGLQAPSGQLGIQGQRLQMASEYHLGGLPPLRPGL